VGETKLRGQYEKRKQEGELKQIETLRKREERIAAYNRNMPPEQKLAKRKMETLLMAATAVGIKY
jgi:hypothetical protein